MADDKKKSYQVAKLYEVKDGKVTRKNPFSPKAGPGHFMAVHKDRMTCGKTGYTEMKKKEEPKDEKTKKEEE
jgi:small subunit ribosomal protein S27Ae